METTTPSPTTEGTDARIAQWPDLAYWYGLGYEELKDMPNAVRRVYEEALPRIAAEETARMIDAVSFPNLDKAGQRRLSRRLQRAMNYRAVRAESADDFESKSPIPVQKV